MADPDAIRGERLTTWVVTPDGRRVCLGFQDDAGQLRSLNLPLHLLSALMMTIPRMLRQGLDARFADGSLRMVHPLGTWRLERATETSFILNLATSDAFEVAFAVSDRQAEHLGTALSHWACASTTSAAIVN